MINIFEVNETNKMIEKENLDVRTITLGISLLDCVDSDLSRVNEKIYRKITHAAKNLVQVGEEISREYGIPIVNKRISVTPIALIGGAACKKNFIIVLNDNKMSISENVGGISRYLSNLRADEGYNLLKKNVAGTLAKVPMIGNDLVDTLLRTKNSIKQFLIPGMWFENMGITYLGPVDGHDVKGLAKIFSEAKKINHAVLIHVMTKKGKGYRPAEKNPSSFHGVEPFDIETGKPLGQKLYPS